MVQNQLTEALWETDWFSPQMDLSISMKKHVLNNIFQFTRRRRGAGKTERCCIPGRRRRRRRRHYWWRERWEETADGLSGQPEPPRGKPQPSSQNIQSDLQTRRESKGNWTVTHECKMSVVVKLNYLIVLMKFPQVFKLVSVLHWRH